MSQKLSYIIKLDNTGVIQPFSTAAFSGLAAGDVALTDVIPENNGSNQTVSVARLCGFMEPKLCDFRLTTLTGVAVTTADRTSQGTLYFTPASNGINNTTITTAGSARVCLYDGTRWKLYTNGEISLSLSLTSGNNYDVFLYDNSGTLTLETLIWTDATTRATALDLQDGVLLKHGALTRRYVGTIRASGSNVTEDSAANRFVWNYYNRKTRPMKKTSATTSWTYALATWRAANGDSSLALGVLVGVPEDSITVSVVASVLTSGSTAGIGVVGIGRAGSTTTNGADTMESSGKGAGATVNLFTPCVAYLTEIPSLGYQSYQWLEAASNTATVTFENDNTTATATGKSYIFSQVMA